MPIYEDLSPTELVERRDRGELWQILDVREPWEIEIANIPDTVAIPMEQILTRMDELDPLQPVAVLCHSGGRSAQVAAMLVQSGFTEVANIAGGIDAWSLELDSTLPRY